MKKSLAIVFIFLFPAVGFAADVQKKDGPTMITAPTPTSITRTRDTASIPVNGDLPDFPGFAMLVGTQGSATTGLLARPLIACDQYVWKDLKQIGEYSLAAAAGKSVNVCSYSISNGKIAQDVQFVAGMQVSSGSGYTCNGKPVSARFHLAPNQFVSQGSGVGVLFTTGSREGGLCLKLYGAGDVGVNVSFAIP